MGTGDNALQRENGDNFNGSYSDRETCPQWLQRLIMIADGYSMLLFNLNQAKDKLDELSQAEMSQATIHTRSDNGGMELLHPSGSTYEKQHGRRREYIGKDLEKQREAKLRVERYQKSEQLRHDIEQMNMKKSIVDRSIGSIELQLFGRQSQMGTSRSSARPAPGRDIPIPDDPAEIVAHFRQSPVLSYMADDLAKDFGL
jgi:hypothetical protein